MGATSVPSRDGESGLLALALSRPNEAMERARALLAARPGPLDASVAHQAIGLVLREFGDIDAAILELRTARRLARRSGVPDREADVLGTLGVALVFAGRTRAGRNALNAAVAASAGLLRGRALLRRGACLLFLGLHGPALDDLNAAIPVLRAADDQIWEARALTQRSQCSLAAGSVRTATADLRRAEALYAANGQELESADAVMHGGVVAFRLGDLPAALTCFDEAADRYATLGVTEPDLTAYRCAALTAAGLAADALREADAAIGQLSAAGGRPTKRAELLLVAADCALAAREPGIADDRAAEAARLFGRQRRRWWRAHARLARVRAEVGGLNQDPPTAALLRDARRCVRELTEIGSPDLPLARLAAGQVALALATAAGPTQESAGRALTLAPAPALAPAPTQAPVTAPTPAGVPTGVRRAETEASLVPTSATARARADGGRARAWRAEADAQLAAAAAGRGRGPALSRAVAWLAQAHRAEAAGDTRNLMHACRRGLAVIDDYRSVFGSTELRAQSTAHGAELAALGQGHAAGLGRPRLMLEWSERWRAVALAVPAVRPPDDELLQADLAVLRDVTSRLAGTRDLGLPTASLEQERQRLERAVRARALHAGAGRSPRAATGQDPRANAGPRTGAGQEESLAVAVPRPRIAASDADRAFSTRGLLDALGDGTLIELVDVGGELHALVCGGGRVGRITVGPTGQATRAVRFARLALRRTAHGPPVSPSDAVVHEWLTAMGTQLDRTLLGPAGDLLGDGNLIVVPPGRLHAVPWGLLPRLRSRAVSVAPSAASWLRARQSATGPIAGTDLPRAARPAPGTEPAAGAGPPPPGGPVVLVRGPGMASRGAEVPRLAAEYAAAGESRGWAGSGSVVLGDGTATVEAVLRAIDGAELAHIAAHGEFRADSPLFSSLRLDDGQLTVYDLERLRRGPRRLVLSSCDSGVTVPAGADEVLGLASSLIPLGTTGIVASVVPVNDRAVVPLMIALHRGLRGGASLGQALRDARVGLESDPVAAATGWSFICLGS
jgi:tetratricopeptide (TPR) repeat protein